LKFVVYLLKIHAIGIRDKALKLQALMAQALTVQAPSLPPTVSSAYHAVLVVPGCLYILE